MGVIHVRCSPRGVISKLAGSSHNFRRTRADLKSFEIDHLRWSASMFKGWSTQPSSQCWIAQTLFNRWSNATSFFDTVIVCTNGDLFSIRHKVKSVWQQTVVRTPYDAHHNSSFGESLVYDGHNNEIMLLFVLYRVAYSPSLPHFDLSLREKWSRDCDFLWIHLVTIIFNTGY